MASGMLNALYAIGEIVGLSACYLIKCDWEPWYVLKASRFVACLSVLILFINNGKVPQAWVSHPYN
jgi:hypothetical protein